MHYGPAIRALYGPVFGEKDMGAVEQVAINVIKNAIGAPVRIRATALPPLRGGQRYAPPVMVSR